MASDITLERLRQAGWYYSVILQEHCIDLGFETGIQIRQSGDVWRCTLFDGKQSFRIHRTFALMSELLDLVRALKGVPYVRF